MRWPASSAGWPNPPSSDRGAIPSTLETPTDRHTTRAGNEALTPEHLERQLAQINIGRLLAPLRSPPMRDFIAAVDTVNRLAEHSGGFVWRLKTPGGHGAVTTADGDDLLFVNVSVWDCYESLHSFVYRGAHGGFLRRRSRWFQRIDGPTTALWWIPAGHRPTLTEAMARLDRLRINGPAPAAFSPRIRFDPTGRRVPSRSPHRVTRRPWPALRRPGDENPK